MAFDARRWGRRLALTLHGLVCLVVLFFGCARGGAFMIVPVLPFAVPWLGWSLYVLWRQPAQRKRQLALMALWIATLTLPLALAQWRAPRIRAEADRVANVIETYHQQHGLYPVRLEEVGLDSRNTALAWGIRYRLMSDSQTPYLTHQSPSNMFDLYVWDGANHRWEYLSD